MFIGLTEIAGYYGNLAKGLAELGVPTTFVDLNGHPFKYASEPASRDRLVNLYRSLSRRRANVPAGRAVSTVCLVLLQKACLLWILGRAVMTCDAFILSTDTSLLGFRELPILKALGKRLVVVFTGSDHRPPYLNGLTFASLDAQTVARCGRQTSQVKRKLRRIERHADVVVGHHLSAHLHERSFVPILLLGIPVPGESAARDESKHPASDAVHIVHAPSNPRTKGTPEIRKAIASLRAKGLAVDLVELVGRPNIEVLAALSRCDFVVDELYSDTRMAVFATEAARFGKPAIVGGYARDEDLVIPGTYPASQFPPVLYCHPDDLESAIERLVIDVPYRLELGRRAQDFVATSWTPTKVAERFVALIRNEAPASWMFDPRAIQYLRGAGMSEAVAREGLQKFIEQLGPPALCLSDKPRLERALQDFASAEPVANLG